MEFGTKSVSIIESKILLRNPDSIQKKLESKNKTIVQKSSNG